MIASKEHSFRETQKIDRCKIQGSEHGRNGRIGRIGTDLWTYLKKWTYPSIRPCVMDVWDGYGRIRP